MNCSLSKLLAFDSLGPHAMGVFAYWRSMFLFAEAPAARKHGARTAAARQAQRHCRRITTEIVKNGLQLFSASGFGPKSDI
ncbi:hypothetical protein LMG29542_06773 [Paraburkholderia humisilvae]|uniref:Uncharacterized protein n=1 Tax=Paraburkholderia humisilvae TaxID=627669 RepID=A0A6J5F2Y4_9BURK|nr:hypothetical protein LMG29542_06773 [Paraburkholderia humisilvae]